MPVTVSHSSTMESKGDGSNQAGSPLVQRRPELRASLQQSDGTPFFVVEDPVTGRFYRIGYHEWRFACCLDGKTRIDQAYRQFVRQRSGPSASVPDLPPERIEPLCRWLFQNGLVCQVDKPSIDPRSSNMERTLRRSARLNPFFIKVPLVRPDRFLTMLAPWFRWAMTWWSLVLWTVLCGAGLHAVYADMPRFLETARIFLSPNTWVYLWATWLLLKLFHETSHGIFCKLYGGYVSDGGVAFILFSPVAFVDVTSAWRFRSRWHRVVTSAAGMYAEFAIAAVAALVWRRTDSEIVSYVCHAVIMAASVTTVLFNGNPLMRFDGYYMLSDALDLPNLYVDGRLYAQSLGSRLFLGRSIAVRLPSGWRGLFVRGYGVAAAVWRVIVGVSMVIGAGALFHGAGLVIAAFGVIAWWGIPLLKLGRTMMGTSSRQSAARRRFCITVATVCVLLIGVGLAPWPGGMRVPAVVRYEPLKNLRAEVAGFVVSVHIKTGQPVAAGDLLVRLRNDDLRVESEQVDRELAQAEIRAQTLKRRREIGQYQGRLEQIKALKERQQHLRDQLARLEIRSPIDGHVVSNGVDSLVGLYVDVGRPILRVASESNKEIHVAIPEAFVESFVESIGQTPRVAIRGETRSKRFGELLKVEPQATVRLRHPALGANNGGPLAVEAVDTDADGNGGEQESVRLVSPRFHGAITLTASEAQQLHDGQLGAVTIYDRRETVARKVYRGTGEWIKNKISISGY